MSFVAMPLLQACGSFLFFTQASLSKEDQRPCHNNRQRSLCVCVMKLGKAVSLVCVMEAFGVFLWDQKKLPYEVYK